MIELTDEMRRAYETAAREESGWISVRCFDAGLADVLALVERDYRIEPRPPWERQKRDPLAPIADPCIGCGCPKDWHTEAGCAGDFMCCPCETWMPVEPTTPPQ